MVLKPVVKSWDFNYLSLNWCVTAGFLVAINVVWPGFLFSWLTWFRWISLPPSWHGPVPFWSLSPCRIWSVENRFPKVKHPKIPVIMQGEITPQKKMWKRWCINSCHSTTIYHSRLSVLIRTPSNAAAYGSEKSWISKTRDKLTVFFKWF